MCNSDYSVLLPPVIHNRLFANDYYRLRSEGTLAFNRSFSQCNLRWYIDYWIIHPFIIILFMFCYEGYKFPMLLAGFEYVIPFHSLQHRQPSMEFCIPGRYSVTPSECLFPYSSKSAPHFYLSSRVCSTSFIFPFTMSSEM